VIGATGCGKTHMLIVSLKILFVFIYFCSDIRNGKMMACCQEIWLNYWVSIRTLGSAYLKRQNLAVRIFWEWPGERRMDEFFKIYLMAINGKRSTAATGKNIQILSRI
jgi:hypothetical protein